MKAHPCGSCYKGGLCINGIVVHVWDTLAFAGPDQQ